MKITDRGIILGLVLILMTSITAVFIIKDHIIEYQKYGYISQIFFPLIGASSFFVGGVITLMLYWGIDELKFSVIVKLLPENERRVMRLLYEKTSLPQQDIGVLCEMSRVKASRAISCLEKRGVLKKHGDAGRNNIVSRIRKTSPQLVFNRLPGVTERRILFGFGLVFLLGVFISVLNSIHVIELEHPLKPANYVFSAEALALGGLTVLFLRSKIARIHVERTLSVLPPDYRTVLTLLASKKTMTQSDIVGGTGINKMKVSRMMGNIVAAGIAEKRAYGNTNLIVSRI